MTIRILFFIISLAASAPAEQTAPAGAGVHSISLPEVRIELKPGPGMDKTAAYCNICHSLDYITAQPEFSKDKWGEIVTKMVKVYGAPISRDAAEEISAYLGSAYGKSGK